ncbi:class I SAM-dependent methyltransferase [Pseudomonas sp. TH05]|jgi:cephalosporin hydroxylase|uniref:CmcI family methyltransferase n=1 Tax=unclassified Pseudomonas TaxID=196821 RepID=UPI000F089895|nr:MULTISPECIES: CmcI family methyltransferase [unclassified Pseudomonas]MBK5538963.1 class I SAM-dependent methyltransferase [Pseudomonas sp. TH07]MBK5560058.1 class I SAM-dependent methyltransferase [Pseudomonas sp. TH05]
MIGPTLRLSRFIVFVDYADFVEVQHAARGVRYRIDRATYEELLGYARFRSASLAIAQWVERGVLVAPFTDTLLPEGAIPGSETALAADYHRWYWRHEIESERDYRWFGEVVLKMPSDLFYLQELLTGMHVQRVLELGKGRGGGAWFLSSILQMQGRGLVVSLDIDPLASVIDGSRWTEVEQHDCVGDAMSQETIDRVHGICSTFELIVIDLGGDPQRNLRALRLWADLLADGGTVVIEDLWGSDDIGAIRELDRFLLDNRQFSLCPLALRHPLLKGIGLRKA